MLKPIHHAVLTATLGVIGYVLTPFTVSAQNTKSPPATTSQHTFDSIDTDKDGRISRSEFAAAHQGKSDKFSDIDSNGDGFISKQEFDAHHASMQGQHKDH